MLKTLTGLTICLGFVASREPEVEIADLFGDVLFQQGMGEGWEYLKLWKLLKKKCANSWIMKGLCFGFHTFCELVCYYI